jgi:hypothetical protein
MARFLASIAYDTQVEVDASGFGACTMAVSQTFDVAIPLSFVAGVGSETMQALSVDVIGGSPPSVSGCGVLGAIAQTFAGAIQLQVQGMLRSSVASAIPPIVAVCPSGP